MLAGARSKLSANGGHENMISLHGEQAALRRAVGELIFFAGVNDLHRCEKIVHAWGLKLDDEKCADYDRRTPLHVASAEGSFSTCEWLLDHGASVNALDRFQRTPLEDAVRSNYPEICSLLMENGAKICEGGNLVPLTESALNGIVAMRPVAGAEFGIEAEWEIHAGDLEIINKLGEGEFGEVFKARYNGTYVAVKQLKSSDQIALGDFRTEMSTLRRLHHPNAVQFLGACTRAQPYLIVTELMSCSLSTAFTLTFSLTLRRQVEVALEFARAMAYMHSRSPALIHRDLKPANIMIGGSSFMLSDTALLLNSAGIVKVADFGLSKSLPKRGKSAGAAHATQPGPAAGGAGVASVSDEKGLLNRDTYRLTGETGSYRYMAPEVFLHEPYNTSVDVYSFAMICYQLFEGCVPYEGVDAVQAAKSAALHKERPHFTDLAGNTPSRSVRQDLRKLLKQCWAHDYSERPPFPRIITFLEDALEKIGPRKQQRSAAESPACCCVQ
eukprot:jgi/Ulvmu1/2529/UM138_0034.1